MCVCVQDGVHVRVYTNVRATVPDEADASVFRGNLGEYTACPRIDCTGLRPALDRQSKRTHFTTRQPHTRAQCVLTRLPPLPLC